ncbi:MAG: polysaccharide lyase family 7 protein [Candidatus Competibacteraceae bacterium]|nr:polysaccharide lyase family 7 protein [Candidatus Competibacteraceae bacterium]
MADGGVLDFRFKIGPLKGGADKIIFAQIHGHHPESKPLLKCIWENGYLRLLTKTGASLDDHGKKQRYLPLAEGQWVTCRIVAGADEVSVFIDGEMVERFGRDLLHFWPAKNTFYFKLGNYLQEKAKESAATVSIAEIKLTHGSKQE